MLGKFRNTCLTGLVALGATFGTAGATSAETLADALVSAYKHSGLLEQNRAVLRAADEGVAQAISSLRPVVSWSANVQRQFGRRGTLQPVTTRNAFGVAVPTGQVALSNSPISSTSANISLLAQLVVYDGGESRLKVGLAKEAVLATRSGLVAIEQQVLFDAVSAFMEVRRTAETVALRNNNLKVIREELRAARDRFAVGEVTRTDVALAEARLSSAESNLAAAQGNYRSAIEAYRNYVGRKPGRLVAPKRLPRIPGSVDAAKAQAVRSHPDMIRAQHEVSAAELGIAIAEAAMNPTVTLRGQYGVTQNFNSQDYTRSGQIGAYVEGPIYQGGRLTSLVREARADRDAARGSLHVVRHGLQENVGNAYVGLEVARASRAAFEDQVRAATVAFRGVREEAKLGARTTLDVLDAEQELLDARANLVSAQVDETIAAYRILATIGQLTAESLKLNVPRYDPTEYYNLVKDAPVATSKQGQELDRVLRALGKK